MTRLIPLIVLFFCAPVAGAHSVSEYLSLRKANAGRAVELAGVVKGTFRAGGRTSLMLQRPDGTTKIVETAAVPEWLVGNEVPVRVLVRTAKGSSVAELVAVAPEADVRAAEVAVKPASAASKPKKASRSKKPALYGPIGRSGSRVSRSKPAEWILPASKVTPIYAAFIKKVNRKLPDAEALRIARAVVGFSLHYRVDARLVMAILMVESGFDPDSVSHAGAMGLGQLMPGTAKWMGVRDPFDPTQNLYGSVKLLRRHLDTYRAKTDDALSSIVLSLAAYNAGEGAVRRHGGVPPYRETQRYVRKVIALYYRLAGHGA